MTDHLGAAHAFAPDVLRGRTAIVTGAGSGIGRASALALTYFGADIAVVEIEPDSAAQTAAAIDQAGHRGLAYVADLGRLTDLDQLVARVVADLGPPTLLVNCAGVTGRTLLETDLEQ